MKNAPICKVLLVSPLPPPTGGIATWTTFFLEELLNAGLHCSLINISRKQKINSSSALNAVFDMINLLKILFRMLHSIIFDSVRIVHISTSLSKRGIIRDILFARLARLLRCAVIIHVHCEIHVIVEIYRHKSLVTQLLLIATEVIVLNKASQKFAVQEGVASCSIIPNFIKVAAPVPKVISKDIQIITFVGHITKYKGVNEITEAARKNPTIQFKLVGPTIEEGMLEEVPRNLIYLGSQTREFVSDLLKESDLFILPSYTEGFSIALLEAMNAGLPVIASDVGANSEMLADKGGVILETISEEAINNAIKTLSPRTLREAASAHNIRRVIDCYAAEVVIKTWIDKYKGYSA